MALYSLRLQIVMQEYHRETGLMSNALRTGLLLLALFGVAGFGGVEALFAPKAELWARWDRSDEQSRRTVDHGLWDLFLGAYVISGNDGVNRVAYGRVTAADRGRLDRYIRQLAAALVTRLNRAEQLAYWINIYNALTVKLILAYRPVQSIRDIDISPSFFSDGPWDKSLLEIEGETVSLNDIEHRILRPIWQDARLHYALNCASIGCPNLQKTAFTAVNVQGLLEKAAREYVNDPRGVRRTNDEIVVSSIYAWFTEDFGGDIAGVLSHLRKYASPRVSALLSNAEDEELKDAYDWRLNDADRN
jgi:hypothetical protein